MATYRYRAVTPSGAVRSGDLEGQSRAQVVAQLRRLGLLPIETQPLARAGASGAAAAAVGGASQAAINAIGELAVLLEAGLPLDRALGICVDNIVSAGVKSAFARIHDRVKEGATLSRALSEAEGLFPPIAAAMCEAGEADGRLGAALARLAETLDRAAALRQTVVSSLVYPAVLIAIASAVILVMLLVVVPQFEVLFQ